MVLVKKIKDIKKKNSNSSEEIKEQKVSTKKKIKNNNKECNKEKKTNDKLIKNSKKDKIMNFVIKHKNILLVSILLIVDLILVIWFAKDNYVNYAKFDGKSFLMGSNINLLFGRNYVGLVVSLFIYIYGVLFSRFVLKNKIKIKWLVLLFCGILLINMLLFWLFTNKVY